MRDAIATLLGKFGGIDIVVANAGINGVWAPIDDLKPYEWDETIAVNLRGTYLTLHLTVPYLKQRGGGAIIVVSSINGTRTFTTPGATAYTATKAGTGGDGAATGAGTRQAPHPRQRRLPGRDRDEHRRQHQAAATEEETAIPGRLAGGRRCRSAAGKPGRSEDVAEAHPSSSLPSARVTSPAVTDLDRRRPGPAALGSAAEPRSFQRVKLLRPLDAAQRITADAGEAAALSLGNSSCKIR